MSNLYAILNVEENASQDEIRKSFRKLSFKYHPDRNNSYDAETSFKELNSAYEVLGDVKKRDEYDKLQRMKFKNEKRTDTSNNSHNLNNLQNLFSNYGNMFQNMTSHNLTNSIACDDGEQLMQQINSEALKVMNDVIQNIQHQKHTNFDTSGYNIFGIPLSHQISQINMPITQKIIDKICVNCDITLEEIFNGTNITISYLRKVYNNNEEKQETIEKIICIEPGIDSKIPIILENQGHVYGNHIGNVEITLNELPHIQYKRNSLHLLMEKTISLKEALTGFSITFQHINNKQYTLQNNNITYPNSQREIPHLGLTNKTKTGSLFVVFNVEFPISLNEEQKQQLKTIL